ncbi:hypothetical protein HII36_16100 [Nonomuraea sp. NN258]|uniref:TolB family protein n=1 Tax=Nonomuraea antri TaxID=2730852 RepID=UPI0015692F07|nr:hypothetical protein [Nonomuraea antri]NRQ33359.1 hypothetical protein [Nonomuraea antri]
MNGHEVRDYAGADGPDEVEDTLRRTLGRAAGRAPELAGGMAEQVEIRYRRRRQRTQALLAAAAVVVIASGVVATLRPGGPVTMSPAPGPSATAEVPPPDQNVTAEATPPDQNATAEPVQTATGQSEPVAVLPAPVEQVWPAAVHKLPAKTSDGREIRPATLAGDRTLLYTTWSTFERSDALYAYDFDTRAHRKITETVIPPGTTLFPSDFTVGEGQVVWWTRLKKGPAQIWAAPLDGGQARLVGSRVTGPGGLDGLQIAGGKVVFSAREGGVYALPLAGGEAEPVAGGASMHVLDWPWIGAPGPYGPFDGARFREIRNVETGETSTAVVKPGEQNLICGVRTCTGVRDPGSSFYRLRDGSDERALPGEAMRAEQLARDRFQVAALMDRSSFAAVVLHDLRTGRSADLGVRAEESADGATSINSPSFDRTGRMLAYPVDAELFVIDVSKIE